MKVGTFRNAMQVNLFNKSLLIAAAIFTQMAFSEVLPDFDALWNYDKPAESEAKFREIYKSVSENKNTAKKNANYILELLTQVARSEALQQKFTEAHKTLDGVEKKLNKKTPVARIRYLLERGRVFNSSQKANKAKPLFLKAFDTAILQAQDNYAVDAAHMMAIVEGDPAKQMEWNLKAVSLAEKSKDPKANRWLGSLYNNMAWTLHDTGKYNEALELFQKALALQEQQKNQSNILIAKWSIARTYRSLQKYDEALQMQLNLENEYEAAGEKSGYVYEEIGELYLALNKGDFSKRYFSRAYNELSKDEWFKANEAVRLERIKSLSDLK